MAVAIYISFALLICVPMVHGHAYLFQPPSRNLLAHNAGQEGCPHCGQSGGPDKVKAKSNGVWPTLNAAGSHGLCGDPFQNEPVTSIGEERYKGASAAPTGSKQTYSSGSIASFVVAVSTHHAGHFEFRICDHAINASVDTKVKVQAAQDCLNARVLQRVPPEESYGNCVVNDPRGDCQPIDSGNPGRWYLPPANLGVQKAGPHWDDKSANAVNGFPGQIPGNSILYHMKYKIPDDLSCTHCTLQWHYATGNSCLYDNGYFTYFGGLKQLGWNAAAWSPNGVRHDVESWAVCGDQFGEEFWNCADIAVVPRGPTVSPTPAPPSVPPTLGPAPRPTTEPEPEPEPTPGPQPGGDARCFIKECGCPPFGSGASWCTENHVMSSSWCKKTETNCAGGCGGVWCPSELKLMETVKGKRAGDHRSRSTGFLAMTYSLMQTVAQSFTIGSADVVQEISDEL